MKDQRYWILAFAGPIFTYLMIALSIAWSPWFSWDSDALSDLGHATQSGVAAYYNLGLFLGGFFLIAYVLLDLRHKRPWTGISLLLSGLILQSIGVYDEVYSGLHGAVSVAFFLLIWLTIAIYAFEARSFLALVLFLVYIPEWVLWWTGVYDGGVAIPETISSVTATAWLWYVVGREDLGLWARVGSPTPI